MPIAPEITRYGITVAAASWFQADSSHDAGPAHTLSFWNGRSGTWGGGGHFMLYGHGHFIVSSTLAIVAN